jgi:hypothetical protein
VKKVEKVGEVKVESEDKERQKVGEKTKRLELGEVRLGLSEVRLGY